ncbi:MAG: YafY family protein [Polyangiaceae bacterium]
MRRADRLFQIIQLLRRRKVLTARQLAEELEVSERTVYRDVRDLVSTGTQIDGEAGVGYSLRAGYDLPPLMFDADEIQALLLGARIVASFGDHELGKASRSVISKVESVLPKHLKPLLKQTPLFSPLPLDKRSSGNLSLVRQAVFDRKKLRFGYQRGDGQSSERTVWPLGAFFWGKVWTLLAYCELREDFRNFRLDRMEKAGILEEQFPVDPEKSLDGFFARMGQETPLD